jgi:hypothetical protein
VKATIWILFLKLKVAKENQSCKKAFKVPEHKEEKLKLFLAF